MLGQMHEAGLGFEEIMINTRGASWRAATAKQVLPDLSAKEAK